MLSLPPGKVGRRRSRPSDCAAARVFAMLLRSSASGTVSRFDHDACGLCGAQAPPTTLRLRGCTCACNASQELGKRDTRSLRSRRVRPLRAQVPPATLRLRGCTCACNASRELGTRDSRSLRSRHVRPLRAQAPPTRAMGAAGARPAPRVGRGASRPHPLLRSRRRRSRRRRRPPRRRLHRLGPGATATQKAVRRRLHDPRMHRRCCPISDSCPAMRVRLSSMERFEGPRLCSSRAAARACITPVRRGLLRVATRVRACFPSHAERPIASCPLWSPAASNARVREAAGAGGTAWYQYELATLAASAPLVDRQSERGRARLARSQAERAPRRRMIRRWLARGAAWRGSARGGGRRLIEVVAPRAERDVDWSLDGGWARVQALRRSELILEGGGRRASARCRAPVVLLNVRRRARFTRTRHGFGLGRRFTRARQGFGLGKRFTRLGRVSVSAGWRGPQPERPFVQEVDRLRTRTRLPPIPHQSRRRIRPSALRLPPRLRSCLHRQDRGVRDARDGGHRRIHIELKPSPSAAARDQNRPALGLAGQGLTRGPCGPATAPVPSLPQPALTMAELAEQLAERVDHLDIDNGDFYERVMAVPGNGECADCPPQELLTWASVNLGVAARVPGRTAASACTSRSRLAQDGPLGRRASGPFPRAR